MKPVLSRRSWSLVLVAGCLLGLAVATSSRAQPTTAPATVPAVADYTITGGDLLRITAWDIRNTGSETHLIKRVSNSGNISMPYFKQPVHVAGMTEAQLEAHLREIYEKAALIQNGVFMVLVVQGADGRTVPPELLDD